MDFPHSAKPYRQAIGDTLTPISSPKRKRDCDSDSEYDNPRASPMRIRTELPSRPRLEEVSSPTSPRSKVSNQLHALKLNKPDLTFSTPLATFGQGQSSIDSSGSWNTSSPPTEPEADTVGVMDSSIPSINKASQETSPSAPKLTPTSAGEPMNISPTPLPTLPPSTAGSAQLKSGRMRSPPPEASPASTRSSPPPYSDLTWTASEITGHNPTDPADDGYGINGVGFRPTPAMAYARTQRRKQQVAEWKNREAKEARQKRMERRKKMSVDIKGPAGAGAAGSADGDGDEKRKVRFLDE